MEELPSEIEIRRRVLAAEASYMRQQLNKPAVSSINRPTIGPLFTRENRMLNPKVATAPVVTPTAKVATTPFVTPTAKIASAPQITKQLSLPLSVAPKPTNAALGGAATITRGAMTVGRMGSVLGWGSMLFPFLKGGLKKGWDWLKRGTKGIRKRVPGAAMLLGGLSNMFGGRDAEGGEFVPEEGAGNALSGAAGGSETLGAALPTLKNPTLPALPTYKKGKGDKDSCCETTSRLLSIAIKYLAGIDATLKNQLDVERASFNQANQAKREQSLEGGSGEKSGFGGSITRMVKSAGASVLSFFSSALLKALILTVPLMVKKIYDSMNDYGFDFGFGDDEEKKDLAPQNGVSGSTTAMNETATRGYRGGGGRGRGGVAAAPAGSSFGSTSFSEVSENIAAAEGTGDRADPYNIVYGYGKYGSPSKPLTEMTLGEVQDFQKNVLIPNTRGKVKAGPNEGTGAVGKYQFNYGTLKEQAEKLYGASWRATKFTPEVQEKLAENLFNERKSSNRGLSSTWAYFRNIDPVGGAILRAQTGGANTPAAQIGAAAVDRAARESGVATTPTTPAPVVVAQNAPPPSSTTVTSGGPGDPSSVSSDRTLMTWIQYFSPLPA